MSDKIKFYGLDELESLKLKEKTWDPPCYLEEFLNYIKLIIETSRYTDTYKKMKLEDLHSIIKTKICRSIYNGYIDFEELANVACYAGLAFMKERELQNKDNINETM